MNSILMVIIAIVILALVFVMFSLDDREEENDFLKEEDATKNSLENKKVSNNLIETKVSTPLSADSIVNRSTVGIESDSNIVIIEEITSDNVSSSVEQSPGAGSEDDLNFRTMLDQKHAPPVSTEACETVVAAVQIRFPEEVLKDNDSLVKLVQLAESIFENEFSFEFNYYQTSQLNKLCLFRCNEERDDALFEALVVAFEIITRFKRILEMNSVLRESRARVAVGLSMGSMIKMSRGIVSEPSWIGKAAYLAESLAEAAADLTIYVGEEIHKAALPLFDFREWKPIKLRTPLPQINIYELVGWNNPSEIASFVTHKEAFARRAVAIAYRYLDLDSNLQPLVELLTDTDETVVIEALETVKIIKSEQIIGLLKRIFPETKDPSFRSAIIDAFGSIGRNEVVPVVIGSTKEANWKVRLSAAMALYKLSGSDALRHLEDLLNDSDGAVKASVNSIFFKVTGKEQYFNNLSFLISDLSRRTRRIAADELLSIGSDAALKIIVASFPEQDLELQKHILCRMEFIKSKILYNSFLAIFKTSDEKIRPAVVEALCRTGLVE